MNWKELKEFVNSLNNKQLEAKVILWREDEAITEIETNILEEDQYIILGEEGCFSLTDGGYTENDIEEKGLIMVYEKGHPLLMEDF